MQFGLAVLESTNNACDAFGVRSGHATRPSFAVVWDFDGRLRLICLAIGTAIFSIELCVSLMVEDREGSTLRQYIQWKQISYLVVAQTDQTSSTPFVHLHQASCWCPEEFCQGLLDEVPLGRACSCIGFSAPGDASPLRLYPVPPAPH